MRATRRITGVRPSGNRGSVSLGFEWQGGPYIEVCEGEAFSHPKEVINVWDYEKGESGIPYTRPAFKAAIEDWIKGYNEEDPNALFHDVTENWRWM